MSRRTVQRTLGAFALAAILGAAAPAEAGGYMPESLGLWSRVWSWVGEWWGERSPDVVNSQTIGGGIDPNGTPSPSDSNPTPPMDPEDSGDAHGTIDPNG